jgi:DNA-binding transcriptional ArsR family regulator
MSGLDGTLTALSDPTRRGVIELLRKRPRRAGELSAALGMSAPAMSRHLRLLRRHGLVEEQHTGPDARVRTYRLRQEPFRTLRSWLEDVELFWARELDAFKRHAERTRRPRRSRS